MSEALNITKAAFGGLREVTTAPLWQYDYGQILQITGLDLPQAFEVHFSNSRKSGETITQIGTDSQVVIPDMYLTSGADIYAFVFLHDGTDDGETEYVIKIPVRERPEPSDIEPTPVQQDAITEAIAALNDAVTQTGEDKAATAALAEAAAASSLVATEAAQSAQGSATSASTSASTASTAAATATQKASEAATSATSAANAKTAAETAETNAEAAQTASESAQASAESSAQTATTKASEASTSATSASGSASAASASASAASESATSAANSATAASASATAAATSASTATTKASEASASATAAQTAQTAAQAAQAAAETAQAEAEAARDETVTEAASIKGLLKDKADIIISNAEGAIATFEDGGDDMPMVSCVAKIEPVQSGEGDPSPENIRPITGWTGCNVVVSPTQDAQDGTTYSVSWQSEAGTVYGGTLDVVSGVLTVDMARVDLGELTFSATTTANIFYAGISDMRAGYSAKIVCEAYKRYSAYYTGMPDKSVANNSTYGYIYIKDTDYSDADTFMASLSGIYLAYEIKNPTTVQLTPHEVCTLLGLNNVWADTGDTAVEYRADTRLYIEKLTQPEEYDMIADSAITSGKFFMIGNTLYRALANIASGATITVGTNATKMSLSDALNALA